MSRLATPLSDLKYCTAKSPKSVVGDWVAGENMTDAEAFSIYWGDTSDARRIGLLLEKWLHPYGVRGWCEFN